MLNKKTVLIICSPLLTHRKIRDAAKRAGCATEMALDIDSLERTIEDKGMTYDAIVWHGIDTDNHVLASYIKTTRRGRPNTPMITLNEDANIRMRHMQVGCMYEATLDTIDAVLQKALTSPIPAPAKHAQAEVA